MDLSIIASNIPYLLLSYLHFNTWSTASITRGQRENRWEVDMESPMLSNINYSLGSVQLKPAQQDKIKL